MTTAHYAQAHARWRGREMFFPTIRAGTRVRRQQMEQDVEVLKKRLDLTEQAIRHLCEVAQSQAGRIGALHQAVWALLSRPNSEEALRSVESAMDAMSGWLLNQNTVSDIEVNSYQAASATLLQAATLGVAERDINEAIRNIAARL